MALRKTLAGLAVMLFAAAALAQFQGRIEGIVRDDAGNPLDGVEVTIVSMKVGSQRLDLKTDQAGRFTQVGLIPGFFVLHFKKAGFAPRAVEVKVSIAEATECEVTLERAAAEAERTMSESDRLFLDGNKYYGAGEFSKAAASYENAIRLSPDQWAYHFNLGLARKKIGENEGAKAAFSRARELNPSSFSVNKEMAESLAKEGDYEEAKKLYRKAVEISADDPDVFYNLGLCEVSTGESGAALDSFSRCVALKPDYAEAYYQLGTLYIGQNKTREALENLEKFLELAPDHEKAAVARQFLDYLKK